MEVLKLLANDGYCLLFTNNTEELLGLGAKLGNTIPSRKNSEVLVDSLSVSTNRTDKSFSAKYKDKSFPFHTDGAYMLTPPRYIILRSEEDYLDCPTLICRLKYNEDELRILQRDVWLTNGGRGKFYTSILNDNCCLRFDLECMRPVNVSNKSSSVIDNLIDKVAAKEIYWKKNLTIIIDNWQMLHSRADASNIKERTLQRIWIK